MKKIKRNPILTRLKKWLKSNRYSPNPSIRFFVKLIYKLYDPVRTVKGILTNKQHRTVCYTKVFREIGYIKPHLQQ